MKPNKKLAIDWLNKSWHHYSSGKLLYEAEHYTDTISIDLHYAVEIILKSILVYDNNKIIKTHNLVEIYTNIESRIHFSDEEIDLLDIINKYHIKGSYPVPDRKMPSRIEIKRVLEFTECLLNEVCNILKFELSEIKK